MARSGINQEKIILTAAKIADHKGLNHLNLHELAKQLGIRPPSLYNHISGIDGLRRAMMLYAIPLLTKDVTYAVIGLSGIEALKAFCMAYYSFATHNPGLYEAMQWWNRATDKEVEEAFRDFMLVLNKILEPYDLDNEQHQHVYCLLRGLMHGFSSIAAFGGFSPDMPLRENYEWSINVTLQGLIHIIDKRKS